MNELYNVLFIIYMKIECMYRCISYNVLMNVILSQSIIMWNVDRIYNYVGTYCNMNIL